MQPEGDIIDNSEVETSEKEIEETGIEGTKKLKKCSHCSRPCKGHEGSTGQKCELDIRVH